jgi:hypothetical protein
MKVSNRSSALAAKGINAAGAASRSRRVSISLCAMKGGADTSQGVKVFCFFSSEKKILT